MQVVQRARERLARYFAGGQAFLQRSGMLPLAWLHFSRGKRLLLVFCSYVLGEAGLWLFFPPTHNGATMFLPIVSACWLFRYRGLLASIMLNGIAFQLSYIIFLQGLLPDSAFVEGGVIGFVTSLGLGLVVCWLRTAVDQLYASRQQVLAAEQARLLALLSERQARVAYEQQREMNALKDQFLLNVSHELRTPLTVLGGYLELLEEHDAEMESPQRIRALREALKGKEELRNLVDGMLDAAQIMGDIPLPKSKLINIYELVQEVVGGLAPQQVGHYHLAVRVPDGMTVWADRQFLHQVLNNLFSNIFKYVPVGTEICLEAEQVDAASPVTISVQDTGPGIPAEEIPLLFEKFVRLKRDLASSTRGTGLGLYICKQLVEAMGGQIRVESPGREGSGSRFCITLPSKAPAGVDQQVVTECL